MSALFNKHEPQNFNEVLGNVDNKILLEGFLKLKEKPQGYLFYGDYGSGKTLLSNLMAKMLNCNNNIYELNASSDRGIDSIRKVIEQCQYKSLDGNPKAYIIDESHQLPVLSQEALLTTLQKPPLNTYFFFCTTDLSKMIPTIKSRCKLIEIQTIDNRILYPYLIEISQKENNEISKLVARKIAESSQGHVRDALNILESVLQFSDENKQLEIIKNGIDENNKTVIDLCRILLKNDASYDEVKIILNDLIKENPESLRKIIINYMMKVLLNGSNKKAGLIIETLKESIYDMPVFIMLVYSLFC
jgi:DNA polymerase III subunit gamma/tau